MALRHRRRSKTTFIGRRRRRTIATARLKMAASCAALLSISLFLSTTTSQIFNTTVFGDYNVTYNVTDNYNTQATEFDFTTTTPSYTKTDPLQHDEPLPVSGSLLTPVTKGRLVT